MSTFVTLYTSMKITTGCVLIHCTTVVELPTCKGENCYKAKT